jgi:hypothetical protein
VIAARGSRRLGADTTNPLRANPHRGRTILDHALFALLVVLAVLASGRTLSIARFSATVPALYLVLARVTARPAVERPVLVLLASLAALHTVLFARGYWAG